MLAPVGTLRDSILAALAGSREMESPLVAACDDTTAGEPGRWTARDHLAHIAHYRDYGAAVLDALRTDAPVPADAEADLDRRNARILAENRKLTAVDARERARASYDRLVQAVERCSDDHLVKPRSPGSSAPVWWTVSGCGWGHVGQHLVHWHLDRDDWATAERAARRVHEIEMASFEDGRHRAAATYNLGCFYATTGHSEEALALVGEALAQAPELCAVARDDPDLGSILHLLVQES